MDWKEAVPIRRAPRLQKRDFGAFNMRPQNAFTGS
jgi:hypothetical protein